MDLFEKQHMDIHELGMAKALREVLPAAEVRREIAELHRKLDALLQHFQVPPPRRSWELPAALTIAG